MKAQKIIEFTDEGYKMSASDRELLAGAITDENTEVFVKEFCSGEKWIKIVLKNVWIAPDWKPGLTPNTPSEPPHA
jgi:hypothetical protein